MTEPVEIRYGELKPDLDELPLAIINRIDREQRAYLLALHDGLPALLINIVRVAAAAFRTIEHLTFDKHYGEAPPIEFAVSIAPLARTLLDSVFTIGFLFEKPAERSAWYYASGWREAVELQARLEARYGTQPEHAAWLAEHQSWVASHEKDLSDEQRRSPANIRWWPNPGRMIGVTDDLERRGFLETANDWFYGALSQDSHLSYMGLARRGSMLLDQHIGERQNWYRSIVALQALALYLALLSEVIVAAKLPYEVRRIRGIWERLLALGGAKDFWDTRYDRIL